jgi:hypothetical protein
MESCNEDPLALAIKETLGDYTCPRDIVAVGDDEIFLAYKGVNYITYFDVKRLYKSTTDKARSVRLKFEVIPASQKAN